MDKGFVTVYERGGMYDFVIRLSGHGAVTDATFMCFEQLRRHCPYRYDVDIRSFDALIGRSRSVVASQFLQQNPSPYMIIIDTDIIFKPSDVEKIYKALLEGYDIVAGAYPLADGKALAMRGYDKLVPDGSVQLIEMASTGFLGVSRKALETIKSKLDLPLLHQNVEDWMCYPFFESGRNLKRLFYISEDWDFCDKAREAGIGVYWHTGVLVGHYKSRVISAEEAIKAQQYTPQQVQMRCPIQANLAEDLAEFQGISLQEAKLRVADNPPKKMADEWNDWTGSVEDFYKQTKKQIYDLVMFNAAGRYWTTRVEPIWNERDKTILDIGCGIGSAALYLGMNRNTVVGYDINPELIAFCQFRNKKFGLKNVRFTTQKPDFSLKAFDLVIATDTLEHIEDLHSFILELGKGMKEGAKFYHHDVWGGQDTHPMHFDNHTHIKEWLEEAGFYVWNEKWAVKQ